MLEPDLVARGQLHPSVRDRLGRVREIAHLGVANLHGVERDAGRVYAIWEFVEGSTLETWATSAATTPRDLLLLARELVLAVEALHARGVVPRSDPSAEYRRQSEPPGEAYACQPVPLHRRSGGLGRRRRVAPWRCCRCGHEDSPLLAALPTMDDPACRPTHSVRSGLASRLHWKWRQLPAPIEVELQADHRRKRWSAMGRPGVAVLGLVAAYTAHRYIGGMTSAAPTPPEAPAAAIEP